jgi:predicted HTH transcriptional regulator
MFRTEDTEVEQRLAALFAEQETITNQDVFYAFELKLTRRRITTLLSRLVREGKLIREGRGSQTRYRQVKA